MRSSGSIMTVLLVLLMIFVLPTLSCVSKPKYDDLLAKYDSMLAEFNKLQADYKNLSEEYNKLSIENEELRRKLECTLPYPKGSGALAHLENNFDRVYNPTWQELQEFLLQDGTEKHKYEEGKFICTDFAEMLHNNAEKAGIRAAFVAVWFVTGKERRGHTLNAFYLADEKRLVYIDCSEIPGGAGRDKIAHLEIGRLLTMEDIEFSNLPEPESLWERKESMKPRIYEPIGLVGEFQVHW